MFAFLPPIGMVSIDGLNKNTENEFSEDNQVDHGAVDVLLVARAEPRPICMDDRPRPSTSNGGLSLHQEEDSGSLQTEARPRSLSTDSGAVLHEKHNQLQGIHSENSTKQERKSVLKSPGFEDGSEETADHHETEYGQPQKLSFEDELTFAPKLNALSLKIAQSRTSVARRIKNGHDNRAAALEEEMTQNFTFKPSISQKSSKIADRLKTDFWTRQKLHTEKQRKKLETGPSTWHVKARVNLLPKQNVSFADSMSKSRSIGLSLSDQMVQKGNTTSELIQKIHEDSPFAKSADNVMYRQRKIRFQETPPHKLESLKPKTLRKLEQRRLKSEGMLGSKDDTEIHTQSRSSSEPSSPNKSLITNLAKAIGPPPVENTDSDVKQMETIKPNHKRSKTMPSNQIQRIHRPLTIDPDRFMKTKIAAEQALRNKKVFMCMGPYPVLRACLRRRGWIEKNFKADIACSSLAKKRSPNNCDRDSDSDDDDDYDNKNNDVIGDNTGVMSKSTSPRRTKTPRDRRQEESLERSGNCGVSFNDTSPKMGKKSCYAYGSTSIGNFEDLDQGFESDSQYGIMSRIARNAVPQLIWTCRRSDIEFNYLTRDQIVNHFVHASSFTTKFGLCINLRNLPWFEPVDPDSFFPRCHRLSSDAEQQDFVDDFRMLSAIGIIDHTVRKLNEGMEPTPTSSKKEKTISSRALLLAMKACHGYLKSKEHLDIEGDQTETEQYGLSEETWDQLVEFYYQVARGNGIITNADNHLYECTELLMKMQEVYPQVSLHDKNIWIVKPGAKSRGRGIMVMDNLAEILKLSGTTNVTKKENKWVVQKYIERPLLIYNTKFDIRQWFLVTDWNPLTLWFYKDCYLRFCSQEYTVNNFDPKYHLANNSIQKDYTNGPRSKALPHDNMWTKEQYITYLRGRGQGNYWDEVIYPSMQKSITYVLQACQDSLEYRKNSFELYGADFMLSEDMRPWLIEINCSPAMGASTTITEKLCAEVIEDTLKVVLDRKENKSCDTGKFELTFKQQYIPIPVYTGSNLVVEGEGCKKAPPQPFITLQHSINRLNRKNKIAKESRENTEITDNQTIKNHPIKLSKTVQLSPRTRATTRDIKFDAAQEESRDPKKPIVCSELLKKEITQLILKDDRLSSSSWQGCLCGLGSKCKVVSAVSAYHIKNASLDVTAMTDSEVKKTVFKSKKQEHGAQVPNRLTKQTLKIARMHRKAKKKMLHATLRYQRSPSVGLSIGPGNCVKPM